MSQAIREARRRSRSSTPTSAPGFCKREVRECYRIAVSRSADAAGAWRNARFKHHETDPMSIPRGVPVFWLGGSNGHGHVSIATGSGGHWTTDLIRPGYFDRTGIARVSRQWPNLRLVGWTEDLDGVRVWDDEPLSARAVEVFQLSAGDLTEGLDLVHELDDREAAYVGSMARAEASEHDFDNDPMFAAAAAWIREGHRA